MRFYWSFIPLNQRLFKLNKKFQTNAENLHEALGVISWAYISKRNPEYVDEFLRQFPDADRIGITVGNKFTHGRNFYTVFIDD
jgi:hypothetical protein